MTAQRPIYARQIEAAIKTANKCRPSKVVFDGARLVVLLSADGDEDEGGDFNFDHEQDDGKAA